MPVRADMAPILTAKRVWAPEHPAACGVTDCSFRLCSAEFTSRGFRFYSLHVATFFTLWFRITQCPCPLVSLGKARASHLRRELSLTFCLFRPANPTLHAQLTARQVQCTLTWCTPLSQFNS